MSNNSIAQNNSRWNRSRQQRVRGITTSENRRLNELAGRLGLTAPLLRGVAIRLLLGMAKDPEQLAGILSQFYLPAEECHE